MPDFSRPTSSYFQTYTPYVPTMYYNHMKYGGDRWATTIKPSAGCSWKSHRKGLYWENPFPDAEDEGVFDSGCSRSMTGNKERLDDFQKLSVLCYPRTSSFQMIVWWRMGHVNYKNMNRLVKGNSVRGLPPKLFKNDHTCVACCKGKQHKASYKAIHAVKAIRCDNGIEFKNAHIIDLCGSKGIKREYSNPRTPQQNGVAERKNRTLIEAARTMVSVTCSHNKTPYALLTGYIPSISHFKPFGCHVTILNTSDHLGNFDGKANEGYIVGYSGLGHEWVSVTCSHNKTPYALLTGYIPSISHFKPFGCHVTILNTSDHLGNFDGKANKGYIVGYSVSNKAYRVYNVPNKIIKESMNLRFLEEKPNVQGIQGATTTSTGTPDTDLDFDYDDQVIIVPSYPSLYIQRSEPKDTSVSTGTIPVPPGSLPIPADSIPVPADATIVSTNDVLVHTNHSTDLNFDDEPTTRFSCPSNLGNHAPSPGTFSSSLYDDEFGAAINNVASTVEVSPVETKRINTIHPQSLIIEDPTSAVQTRSKVKQTSTGDSAFISYIFDQQRDNHTYFQHCLCACFLSQVEPRSVAQALEDPSWVDAMQEEMQQFKFQN
nr:hypothetical protein [Tanacetum cinerariifolium]